MCLLAICASMIAPVLAHAGITMAGTRFVYPGDEKEILVNLRNDGRLPVLVQTWLDAGNAAAAPGADKVPFVVLPPLARVEPGRGQAIRISYLGDALAPDRESVFWINVLEVPPKVKKAAHQNLVKVAFRTRMKMFYRPAALQGKSSDAADAVRWSVVDGPKGAVLRATNDSAYNVTFISLKLATDGATLVDDKGGMVTPHGSRDFPMKGLRQSATGQLRATWLNDFGAGAEHSYTLTP